MRIGELAAATETTTTTLRFYEDRGLLPRPARTPAGYRDYQPPVVARLDFIRRAQAAGLTLAQIRQVLDIRDSGRSPCEHVSALLADRLAALDRQIADLQGLRDTVAALHAATPAKDPATCTPDEVCRYL